MFVQLLASPGLEVRVEHEPYLDPVVTAAAPSQGSGTHRVIAVFGPGIQVLARRIASDDLAAAKLAEAPGLRRIIPHRSWTERAQCSPQVQDKVWFGNEEGARPALKRSDMATARKICQGCSVARECLTDALTDERPLELYGIWAGASRRQRRDMLRRIAATEGLTVEEVVDEWVRKLLEGSIRA